ncbi:hypothetical protein SAMD00023353_3300990 [Rosellinia necatrix]|uniref:Uncharacterized protein n=1 Tax=Rosellinia necatrix TaxID=77044 RepID=A0A1S8A980_ROSNE|nr:hypothetical protein SAMD00023353_3300990 [Rosellinia necatrix]
MPSQAKPPNILTIPIVPIDTMPAMRCGWVEDTFGNGRVKEGCASGCSSSSHLGSAKGGAKADRNEDWLMDRRDGPGSGRAGRLIGHQSYKIK